MCPARLSFAVLLVLVAGLAPAQERVQPPDAAKQAEAEKVIKDLFKQEYAKKGAADRVALAGQLLEQGVQTKDDPASRYVLYREAALLAAEGGDLPLALRAVDHLSNDYVVGPARLKATVLERAGAKAASPEGHKAVVSAALQALEEAVEADDFDTAEQLGALAKAAASKAKAVALVTAADARVSELAPLRKDFEKVKPALDTLAKKPTDAAANSVVGRYRCFAQGDWERGLPYLAQGDDARLKAQAEKDAAAPKAAADQVAVADGWSDLAAKQEGAAKWQMQRRAYSWYKRALPGLTGLTKTKVEKRMEELEALARTQGRRLEKGTSWVVLFRSSDPSIWNTQVSKGTDYAIPVEKAPKDLKYLRLTNTTSGDYVVIEMTPKKLTELSNDGRYGWEGRNEKSDGAYHLGVTDTTRIIKEEGEIYISLGEGAMGWGFGIGHFVADKQAYSWDGKPLGKTVFEIAVTPGPLSATEGRKLLKKRP